MKKIKSDFGIDDVAEVVKRSLGDQPSSVCEITTGVISSTFECFVNRAGFIVQFSKPEMSRGPMVEAMFGHALTSAGVPLRELVATGNYRKHTYTIARKAGGVGLSTLEPEAFRRTIPSVFDALIAIASVDVSETTGYGWFDEHGTGPCTSWLDHLHLVTEEEPGKFYGHWHTLFEETFLERRRFDDYYAKLQRTLEGVEIPRNLVHGSFGYNNVLVDDGRVTVVIDWQDTFFGDPLYQLAYLDFWPSGFDLVSLFESHCRQRGIQYDAYRKRVIGSKYYIALDAMRFFAKTSNEGAYRHVIGIAENLPLSIRK